MPLTITLPDRFELVDQNGRVQIPVILLRPEDRSTPYVSAEVSIRGNPSATAELLEAGYQRVENVRLDRPGMAARFPMLPLREGLQIPRGSVFELELKVTYCESDPHGKPREPKNHLVSRCELIGPEVKEPEVKEPEVKEPEVKEPEVIPPQPPQLFPGWMAIDFGTSNSTATIYNPERITPVEGFPPEQESRLRRLLVEWLNGSASSWAPEVGDQWAGFLVDLEHQLNHSPALLLEAAQGPQFHRAIRRMETCLRSNSSAELQRAAFRRLAEIYDEVLQIPPLLSVNLMPAVLERHLSQQGVEGFAGVELLSEIEVESIGSTGERSGGSSKTQVQVNMGDRVRQARQAAMATTQPENMHDIVGRFHFSPKRYLGRNQKISVVAGGSRAEVEAESLVQSAWRKIWQLAGEFQNHSTDFQNKNPISRVILTYPTVAPPNVRREIRERAAGLGFHDPVTDYDEAVAAAIFYLFREFAGDLNLSLESFKVRCREVEGVWYQNVLVFDIGGGTTDIALIQLAMHEDTSAFEPGESRGAGGRYYMIKPRLLGASGHPHLGGDLLTLQTFRLLKVALADHLLTANRHEALKSAVISDRQRTLDERYLQDGNYRAGALLQDFLLLPSLSPSGRAREALDAVEQILPTRWKRSPGRLQLFSTLWRHAEEAKIALGKRPETLDAPPRVFTLGWEKILEMLRQSGDLEGELKQGVAVDNLSLTISATDFEAVAQPVVREAVKIARGVLSTRLRRDGKEGSQVDWLILSGKTCNLHLVEREIRSEFRRHSDLRWNSGRITFVPEFAKLATSAGACYAESVRRIVIPPRAAKPELLRGMNFLQFHVKTLFELLPCDFFLNIGGDNGLRPLFRAGEKYRRLDSTNEGKIRSTVGEDMGWGRLALSSFVYRQDTEEDVGARPLWGSYSANDLALRLIIDPATESVAQFLSNVRCQFEVNHRLELFILLCRGEPQYLVDGKGEDISAGLNGSPLIVSRDGDQMKQLELDIVLRIFRGAVSVPGDDRVIFKAGDIFDKGFRRSNDKPARGGMISPIQVERLDAGWQYQICLRKPDDQTLHHIAELKSPTVKSDYDFLLRFSLDDEGVLRVHAGEVPYVLTTSEEGLRDDPGAVYSIPMQLEGEKPPEDRDAFCGQH